LRKGLKAGVSLRNNPDAIPSRDTGTFGVVAGFIEVRVYDRARGRRRKQGSRKSGMTEGAEVNNGDDGRRADDGGGRATAGGERNDRAQRPPGPVHDKAAALDPKVQEQLGRVFRNFCDDLVKQPIPDKLSVLLARLEARQREKE
jgi:hypothetical protein